MSLGLLYAKVGEYAIAAQHLKSAVSRGKDKLRAKMALALVYNKLGLLNSSGMILKDMPLLFPNDYYKVYPIRAVINPKVYDVKAAQTALQKNRLLNSKNLDFMLFYFAPYKVFNAKQTISFIRKGGINIFIDQISDALDILRSSKTISQVNKEISIGIQKALDYKIIEANRIFQNLIKIHPKHDILHYNLALTFAQLGDYKMAYKYFRKSYYLNPKNFLSGIFASICGKYIDKNNDKLVQIIKDDIDTLPKGVTKSFYEAMIFYEKNNYTPLMKWIEQKKELRPMYIYLELVAAFKMKNKKLYEKSALKLKSILPDDIVTSLLLLAPQSETLKPEQFALKIQKQFFNSKIDYNSLFNGPLIVRKLYTKILLVGGLIHRVRDILKQKFENSNQNSLALMNSLAYLDIFSKNYDEAYFLYNSLIDEHGQKDTNTIYLAAVDSIAANHPENAIALLELAKLKDSNNIEARYALGLLYQEVNNFEGAAIQYAFVGDKGFSSEYFSFVIDLARHKPPLIPPKPIDLNPKKKK